MKTIRILFLGDIVGSIGRSMVRKFLPNLSQEHKIDIVVANGENIAGGNGITPDTLKELYAAGVDVVTAGNHSFDKKEGLVCFEEPYLIRPQNFSPLVPGKGFVFWEKENLKIGILNLQGRVFMQAIDCPFRIGKQYALQMKAESPILIVDFHAEATSEKIALAYYLSGIASAVVGTHTHVQTADERIIDQKTLYISDVGMIGSLDSIIGMKKDKIINRFLTGLPERFEVANKGPLIWESVLLVINEKGEGINIERVKRIFDTAPDNIK